MRIGGPHLESGQAKATARLNYADAGPLPMQGRSGGIILAILVLAFLLPWVPVEADGAPPVITDIRWSPRYPINPQNVTLYANVSDPDGILKVRGTWCTVDGICTFPQMYHMGNGVYQANVSTLRNTIAAGYQVFATDMQGNEGSTSKVWALYADSLTLTLDAPVVAAQPSSTVMVTGTAFYGPRFQPGDGENRSAPAEGVAVHVTVDGVITTGAVDADGSFAIRVVSPAVEGSFPIVVSATDRSLNAEASGTMAVSSVPRPDLGIANVRLTPEAPIAGERVVLDFDVKNVGSADAIGVQLLVHVVGLAESVLSESISVPQGGSVHRSASWQAIEGARAVHIIIDPDDAVLELDEDNNFAVSMVTGTPAFPYLWVAAGGAITAVAVGVAWALRRRGARQLAKGPAGKDT